MGKLYEEFRDRIEQERGIAIATVVRGAAHVGTKLLIYPDASSQGTLGSPQLDQQVIGDAMRAIWSGVASTHTYNLEPDSQAIEVFIEGFPHRQN
ncbi:XdhC family protein [Dictyobacter kobayashii]|uniref:XdhC- CoxI domain-containing protein n=1 Tax=Dictyobacter kobayashii TaxID=2014872 RepID=A0A402AC15_9CHLR|nr:XdhC family protein [Dictyobacter kobayashii]GCE16618.1 hypothetical protein KDK_04180 [Dictyobacter kobayashii]